MKSEQKVRPFVHLCSKSPSLCSEKKFKEWSKKARELRNNFSDNQLEEFKMELKKLSDLY